MSAIVWISTRGKSDWHMDERCRWQRRMSCNSSKLARLISLSKSTSLCYPSLTPNTARNGLWCNYRGHMLLKGHSDCWLQHSPTFGTSLEQWQIDWATSNSLVRALFTTSLDGCWRRSVRVAFDEWQEMTRRGKKRKVFRRSSLSLPLFRQRSEAKRAWLEKERIIQRMNNSMAFVSSRNEQLRRWILQRHRLLFYGQAVRFHRVYFNCILIVFITLVEHQKTRVSDLTNFFMSTYLLLHLTLTWAFLRPPIYSVKFNFHLLAEETILCPASSPSLSMFANRGWTLFLLCCILMYSIGYGRERKRETEQPMALSSVIHTHRLVL